MYPEVLKLDNTLKFGYFPFLGTLISTTATSTKRHVEISLCFIIILSRLFYLVHFLQFGRRNWYEQLQSENRE